MFERLNVYNLLLLFERKREKKCCEEVKKGVFVH